MNLTHDPEDEDAFAAISAQLVAQCERSPGGKDLGWVADQLLHFKHGYLDGDLGRWTAADLSEVLVELYPRKVVLEPGDEAEVLAGAAAFLRFLDAEGLLTGEDGGELAGLVEQAGSTFLTAMRDERRWGPGKRPFGGAAAAGVDLTDQQQLDAYVRGVNALPPAAREALLGPSPALPRRALPPVVLPPREELVAAAESSVLLGWVRALVQLVGKGLTLTDKGNLRLADGKALVTALGNDDPVDEVIGEQTFSTRSTEGLPDVDLTFRLAVAAGFLAVDGRRVVPTDAVRMPADNPLDAVFALWRALVEDVGPMQHRWAKDTYGFDWYAGSSTRACRSGTCRCTASRRASTSPTLRRRPGAACSTTSTSTTRSRPSWSSAAAWSPAASWTLSVVSGSSASCGSTTSPTTVEPRWPERRT